MATYTKVSEVSAASALDGTEQLLAVQTAGSVYVTPNQIHAYAPAGITATSVIIGEFMFDENSELDYDSSFTDGQASAVTTFTELPANTAAILIYTSLGDTGIDVKITLKRTSAGTQEASIGASFADGGVNRIRGMYWIPTDGNTIYVTEVVADTTLLFRIHGYKIKAT